MSIDALARPRELPSPSGPRPVPDLADTAEAEIVLQCGAPVPGPVADPCQHSSLQVLCCDCAGCTFDMWSCGKEPVASTNYWYDAHVIAERFDPWMRHRYALVLYAVIVIVGLASQVVFVIVGTLAKFLFTSLALYLASAGWIVERALN